MYFRIQHSTCYTYPRPVTLKPHILRLRPRSDAAQTLHQCQMSIQPQPTSQSPIVDLEGNHALRLWFDPQPTPTLQIQTHLEVATHRCNPFDYLADPWAMTWPLDYPSSLAMSLQPYLHPIPAETIDAEVVHLAQSILQSVEGNISYFLTKLTQRIYEHCQYQVRETGAPLPAGMTWRQQKGSCRDFAMLFIAACRVVGLAARFVSGYEAGDPDQDQHDLHAWVEVYLPGGGWRGFDPTHGLAVADRHVALVASPFPQHTGPVSGRIQPGDVSATLETTIHLDILDGGAEMVAANGG